MLTAEVIAVLSVIAAAILVVPYAISMESWLEERDYRKHFKD